MTAIKEFRDDYYFLSNFHICIVQYENIFYHNAEAAFQSAKLLNKKDRYQFTFLAPCEAKALGRQVLLRKDWEKIKYKVMYDIVKDKFTRNIKLKYKLIDTNNAQLIEGNTWGDTYWGVYKGKGLNMLGNILMGVRAELITSE